MTDVAVEVKKMVGQIKRRAITLADEGLVIMRNSALEVLSRETFGRRYRYGVASTPGATPNPQSGDLRRNWSPQKSVGGNLRITLKITNRMFYAVYLENSTRKMAARPFKEPIKKVARPQILKLYSDL